MLEVTLRNSISKEATRLLGPFWFDNVAMQPNNKLSKEQNAQVSLFKQSISKARNDIRRDLKLSASAVISEDRIIAKMTFGFWTNLFGSAFEVNRNPRALWPVLLRPVFPNAPKGYRDRTIIQQKLLAIKNFRNKAFHHEPVWNIGRPVTMSDVFSKLIESKDIILETIHWISIDSAELARKAGYVDAISKVCSQEYLNYMMYPDKNNMPLSKVKRNFRGLILNLKGTTNITLKGVKVGKLISNN